MSSASPTQERSFYLQPALKDSIGGRRHELEQAKAHRESLPETTGSASTAVSSASSEADPYGLAAKVPGAKMDSGKVDVMQGAWFYFPRALIQVARVSEAGAKKYSWKGWEKVANGIMRYTAAMGRHIKEDPFSTDDGVGGLGNDYLHASQVAWNALARLELIMRELENKNEKQG